MRRRVISPLKNGILNSFPGLDDSNLKIFDIATGTGRTLQQIRSAFQNSELTGLDLSASYLKQASKYLNNSENELVQLIKGNAEKVPILDNSFHAITCVFLFHELPGQARENVIKECYRLLKPNGVLILADSIQLNDSPKFSLVLENFHRIFHEPYYKNYIRDDIDLRLSNNGFESINSNSYFMTKVWSAIKN